MRLTLPILVLCFASPAFSETHPVILYTSNEAAGVKARLSREPYASWLTRLTAEADAILAAGIDWQGSAVAKRTQALDAKLLAAAYALGDSGASNRAAYGAEAVKALRGVPTTGYKVLFSSDTDLGISEAAVLWAEAYDLLAGAGYDFSAVDSVDRGPEIRGNLSALRTYMARNEGSIFPLLPAGTIGGDFSSATFWATQYSDNHHVKLFGALTVLSLAILDESKSQADFDKARGRLLDVLGTMTITGDDSSPAGGWAEGPSYHEYTAHEYLPALTALEHAGLFSYAANPEIVETHFWLPRIVMPDGYMPPFDDNEAVVHDLAGLFYSRHRDRPDRGALLWLWSANGRWVPTEFLPDYIAQFDDSVPSKADPVTLGWTPTGFFPETGYARFRSSWEKDATYLLFLTEHGEARVNGQAHEHPDPNSFLLHSRGELLMLDSGYGGFALHDSTRFARNHNLILVDGDGPPGASKRGFWYAEGADAFLGEGFTSPALDYVSSRTAYLNAGFTRHVIFSGKRFFLLFDIATSNTGPRTFTLLLHGNGGGTSGGTFAQDEHGGVWEHGKAGVRAFCAGTNDRTPGPAALFISTEDMRHAVYQREPLLTHTVLRAAQDGASARFLTLLLPYGKSETVPGVSLLPVSPAENGTGILVSLADTTECWAVRGRGAVVTFPAGSDSASSDGDLVSCRVGPDGSVLGLFFINGGFFTAEGDTLAVLSTSGTFRADFSDPVTAEGYLVSSTSTTVALPRFAASQVTFNGEPVTFTAWGGRTVFTVTGNGAWQAKRGLTPPSNFRVDDVPSDQGHQLQLTWTLSPDDHNGRIAVYRIFRSRSPVFTDPVPLPRFTSLDSLAAWETGVTALIDSVSAGVAEYRDTSVALNNTTYYYWLQASGPGGASKPVAVNILTAVRASPRAFSLGNAYPNPFNPVVKIPFSLGGDAGITLTVYNASGAKVAVILNRSMRAGAHEAVWNASSMPSGLYFITLRAGKESIETRKLILLK